MIKRGLGDDMVQITVIMPLYNAEKYLKEALNSVLQQSLVDFEIICVNDASDDNTLDILEKFRSGDSRVKIISNFERIGAARSRNRAMNQATGEYLCFLDGDDVFDSDMLKVAYKTAKEHHADVAEYSYKVVNCTDIYKKATIVHSEVYRERFCSKAFRIADIEPYEFMNCHSGPWDKLYRREFIERKNIMFQDLPNCNDVYFVNMTLLLADSIIFVNDNRVMAYIRQHSTPSRISCHRDPMNAYLADKAIIEATIKEGKMEEVFHHLYYRIFCHLVETLKNIKDADKAHKFYLFLQNEGIRELCRIGENYYNHLNFTEKSRFEQFETKDFESGWYKEEGEFFEYLEEKANEVQRLFLEWRRGSKNIGLWGAGRNGRIFLRFCRQHNIEIDEVFDINPNMWGQCIYDYPPVSDPQLSLNNVQVVVVTSSNILDEITYKIHEINPGIQILDMNLYIGR